MERPPILMACEDWLAGGEELPLQQTLLLTVFCRWMFIISALMTCRHCWSGNLARNASQTKQTYTHRSRVGSGHQAPEGDEGRYYRRSTAGKMAARAKNSNGLADIYPHSMGHTFLERWVDILWSLPPLAQESRPLLHP